MKTEHKVKRGTNKISMNRRMCGFLLKGKEKCRAEVVV